jgi:uncharacterized membrane protein
VALDEAAPATGVVTSGVVTTGRTARICLGITVALIASYVVALTRMTTDLYRGYGFRTFDIAFYDQGVWLLSRFHAPFVTLMGRNLFGDHAQFSLVALVPLYWLRPDPTTLLFLQALALGLGAVPVYMLAMRRLRNPVFATVLVAAFLLHPALSQTNLENFHPDALLVPILGFVLYAAIEDKPRMLVVFSVLALLCKEDVVLVVLPIAIWYMLRRNRRIGAILAGASIAAALLATNLVMQPLVGVSTRNAWRIPFSDCTNRCSVTRHVSDFAKAFVTRPAPVARYLFAGDTPNGRPFYIWQMLAPTGLVFLVAPEVAATVLLVLAANVFSLVGYQHQIAYHYSMVLLPGLALGTVYAISRLERERARRIAVAVVGGAALVSAYMWGPLAFSRQGPAAHAKPATAVTAIDKVRAQIPANAIVSAYDAFAPHVAERRRVYLWPTPFSALHWKLFEQEGRRLPEADDVEYLFLPTHLDDHPDVLDANRDDFVEVARAENDNGEGAVLYKRVRP